MNGAEHGRIRGLATRKHLALPARPMDTRRKQLATSFLKGLDLLTVLARQPDGLSMPALTARIRQPRTTLLRLLVTLEHYGLVSRRDSVWRTTDRFHDWCKRDMHHEIKERHHAALRRIASAVDELVELGVAEGDGVRFIDWVQANHPITIDPRKSSLHPLHRTATGKLILSQRPDLCTGLKDRRLLAEIAEAGRTGIAWNRRESDPNIMAVATWAGPVSSLTPVICVKWPFFRFEESKAQRALACIHSALRPEKGGGSGAGLTSGPRAPTRSAAGRRAG